MSKFAAPNDAMRAATNRAAPDKYFFIPPARFRETYAADVPAADAQFLADSQQQLAEKALAAPVSVAAWRTKPSYAILTTQDHVVSPQLQRWMYQRSGAKVTELSASHAVFVSQPDAVARVIEAAAKYKIPWIRHDFPLPFHAWSMQAAVNARWFDTKSKKLGDDYRDFIFANQPSVVNLDGLRRFTEQFAQAHNIALPFAMDPQGKLAGAVKADYALGQRIGIEHTPTIWVVTANSKGAPFIEVLDRTKLFQLIDQALEDTKPASSPKTAHK